MPISLKSSREINNIRRSGAIVAEVLDRLRVAAQPGVSLEELDRIANELIESHGAKPSFLGHQGFPASICASVNDEVVHGIPSPRQLEPGDIVSIDVGVLLDGYHADAALTLPIEPISPEAARLIEVTEAAFFRGLEEARAGRRIGDISAAIQEVAQLHDLGIVRELTGHGIGRSLWEDPQIPNYGHAGSGTLLRSGMTIAVEPMLTIGDPSIVQLEDGWTVVTRDGGAAAHFEHTILITTGEPELLTKSGEHVI
ncbi:MAG TPA: type I methionyl aminopeptidase [Nitrolancea sp.]|jgi:methionyl aminopeptidase|nr:type I methionyl aminopeptidase [Nitrolancea sp.]